MRWSIGRTKFGQVDEVLDTNWDEFTDFLADASKLAKSPIEKDRHWWVAPFLIKSDSSTRTELDVIRMAAWLALDLDHDPCSLDSIRLKLYGLAFVCHSTTQAQPDNMRWRLLIRLSRETSPEEYRRLWRYYAHKFQVDNATCNCSRIYYLPATWDDAANVFHVGHGTAIDVESILAMQPKEPPMPQVHSTYTPVTGLSTAPDGTQLITRHMLLTAHQATPGGRLYRLLCQAAKRYRINGWTLDANELAQAGLDASNQFSPGKPRTDIQREANRAIAWANTHCQPLTPLEKMRSRILWERTR